MYLLHAVPEFNIRVHVRTDAACEVTDEEMQKTFVKKHNSFSSHCKKIWGRRKESLTKSVEEEVRDHFMYLLT